MAFFTPMEEVKATFNKEQVLAECLVMLDKEFGAYKVILSKDDPWDILVIRMVSKLVKINAHHYEGERLQDLQEVFAFNIMAKDEPTPDNFMDYAKGWTRGYCRIHDAATLKRKLMKDYN